MIFHSQKMIQKNIPLLISDDAHTTKDTCSHFEVVENKLKEQILDAYINNKLKAVTTRDGDSIVVPDRWAKDNAKEVVSYKYKK